MLYVSQPRRQKEAKSSRLLFLWQPNVFLSAPQPLVDPRPRTLQLQLESPNWPCPGLIHPQEWF